MITENLSTLKIHKLTQSQYDRELEAGRIDPSALYLTPSTQEDLSDYVQKTELPTAINTALAQAKASGEFDGKDGVPGADGYTPVRGEDYWTEADKNEIKAYVDDAILRGAW